MTDDEATESETSEAAVEPDDGRPGIEELDNVLQKDFDPPGERRSE